MSDRLLCGLLCVVWIVGLGTTAVADDEPVKFKDYSRVAEMTVEKFLRAVDKLSAYSDEAVIKMETGVSMMQQPDQKVSFAYAKPRRFRIRTQQHDICSDGKELTVHMSGMRRYTVSPLDEDISKQVSRYIGTRGMSFGIAELILAKDARKTFAEMFEDMDAAGYERIDEDRCMLLSGSMSKTVMGIDDANLPVTLYLRERDMMLMRAEVDLIELLKKQFDSEDGMIMPFKEYKMIYDVRELHINEPIDEDRFKFDPPEGSKKIEKFYSADNQAVDTAAQFELSGSEAPEFELKTTEGEWVSLESLAGKVVVLDFLPQWRMSQTMGLSFLDEIQREFAEKEVSVVCVQGSAKAEKLTEEFSEKGWNLTVALDPDAATKGKYFEEQYASGIVLISRDGIVQGRYSTFLNEVSAGALRKDIDKLLAGGTLPGATAMSDVEREEADEQRGARFRFGATAEPLNEDRLHEIWSVRASLGTFFSTGSAAGPDPTGEAFWVRDKKVVKRVTPRGEITAELPLPETTPNQFSQDRFVAGELGPRLGVVLMHSIAGEEEQMGYRPPKQVVLIAGDKSGATLWKLKFDVTNFQLPTNLILADIDGRRGGEVLFVHESALWIVDDRGEAIVRKPLSGGVQWVIVDDRDHDRRPELYVRTQAKLYRFEYRPQ